MALVNCPECGREKVSDTAVCCPTCGYGIKEHFEKIRSEIERKEKERTALEQQAIEKIKVAKKEQERYDNIKMPKKPKVSVIAVLILVVAWVFMIWFTFISKSIIFFICSCIVLITFTYMYIDSKLTDYENYFLAVSDFDEYKRKKIQKEDDYAHFKEEQATIEYYNRMNAPKCPMCKSVDINKISSLNRAVSISLIGLASDKIGKQYKCKDCGHLW